MKLMLPNPDRDRELIPCPRCGAGYVIAGKRPAILMFNVNHYQVVCLQCQHRVNKSKQPHKAIQYWNEQVMA